MAATLGNLRGLTQLTLTVGCGASQLRLLQQVSCLQSLQELVLLSAVPKQETAAPGALHVHNLSFDFSKLTPLKQLTRFHHAFSFGIDDTVSECCLVITGSASISGLAP